MRPAVFLLLFLSIIVPCRAMAGWTARIPQGAPEHFFAEDKGRDVLHKMAGATIVKEYPSIHGKVEGDKQVQGDLKTPEGIYFVTRKVTQQLDFMEYGPHAFALSYPNPVDRLLDKTGGGIWLHSKGRPIKGVQTRGCIAVEQEAIISLVPDLAPGTPVLIAQSLAGVPFDKDAAPAAGSAAEQKPEAAGADREKVLALTRQWLAGMEKKEGSVLSLYDAAQWKKANREEFSAFAAKKRTELALAEGPVKGGDVRLLEGPGYWTAFCPLEFKGKDGTQQVSKVLYWLPDGRGSFLIIGEFNAGSAADAEKS